METYLDRLQSIINWQQQYLGRQMMQQAVLQWAIENKDALNGASLTESLVAIMDSQIAVHNAARPSK